MIVFTIQIINGTKTNVDIFDKCLFEEDYDVEDYTSYPPIFENGKSILKIDVRFYDDFGDMVTPEGLAIKLAKAFSDIDFVIEGHIDTSESAGEYMDFLIEYHNRTLISKSSSWYINAYLCDYDNYNEFAQAYCDKKGKPRLTKEQFESFKDDDIYILNSGRGDFVREVPLVNVLELDLSEQ